MESIDVLIKEIWEVSGDAGNGLDGFARNRLAEAAELFGVTEAGYQQISRKNDELQGIINQLTLALTDAGSDLKLLRAALSEISEDPTGVSSYQADIAKRALDGNYQPF